MKIVVLTGSPKGAISVTMQYVLYMQKKFSQHEWQFVHIAQRMLQLEKDAAAFQEVLDTLKSADVVLWAFPVYFMLVHASYKRFIELVEEHQAQSVFKGKYTAAFSTSIHFYDHTAHNYMHAICDDWGMRYVGFYSADMDDLHKPSERAQIIRFAEDLFAAVAEQRPTAPAYAPLVWRDFSYRPGPAPHSVSLEGKRLLLLHDAEPHQTNLLGMIERFQGAFAQPITVINLRELDIKGGCTGCLHCAYNNECIYEGKDEYVDFFKKHILQSDIVVFAGTLRDRYLSALWKLFSDRSFFRGHAPSYLHKQMGFIISGPLSQNANLRHILTAESEFNPANMAGVVTDEQGDAAQIDALLQDLGARLVRYAVSGYVRPGTFIGVAARKLFRDAVYGGLRGIFQADHRIYQKLGWYDFPQKNVPMRLTNALLGILMKIPGFRKMLQSRMKEGMIQPYKKVLEE